jgi:Uma2 family endonuclease
MSTQVKATIEDLYSLPHDVKAEVVDGEIVIMSPTGAAPSYAAGEIFASLRAHCRKTKVGFAVTDNAAFRVYLPNRESFSPDAALYTRKWTGMKFFEGAPVFAVEVRSSDGYGPTAEKAIANRRADYFAAGTMVVWDLDLLSDDAIKGYSASDPETPIIFHRGEIANAEPAVPGWSMAVDDLFPILGDV